MTRDVKSVVKPKSTTSLLLDSSTSWADHVTWGMCICTCVLTEVMCNWFCSVCYIWDDAKERAKPGTGTWPTPVAKHQGNRQA